jgi:hypothetical protein
VLGAVLDQSLHSFVQAVRKLGSSLMAYMSIKAYYLYSVGDGPDNGRSVAFSFLHGLIGSQEEDVVVPSKLSREEERSAQVANASLRGVAERRLELLEPLPLHTEGAVERRYGGDVVLLEVGQVQSRGPGDGEIYALAEVLPSGQGRRQERQSQSIRCINRSTPYVIYASAIFHLGDDHPLKNN